VKREFGARTPDTPAARKKTRIAGGILAVAILLMLVANLIGAYGGPREIIGPLLYAGGALLLAGIIYILMNRRAS
jgi:drug/metabolite transporter (DMT)-like permease